MTSMLENLIGGAVRRRDNKRLSPSKRPLPNRPRDLLELFSALGEQATVDAIYGAADFREADPRALTYFALNRWPTPQELASRAESYDVRRHLRQLLQGEEFRASLLRRICDAFPEKRRLLHVCIPRCASKHFVAMASAMHPVFPPHLGIWRRKDDTFFPDLGRFMQRFNTTQTIQAMLPSLSPFVSAPEPDKSSVLPAAPPGFAWALNPPPFRANDRLFTIVRDPSSLVLSQINAVLTALQKHPSDDTPQTMRWRHSVPAVPSDDDTAAWKKLGCALLAGWPDRNPICNALGDGTARGALASCRHYDIEIADFSRYATWVKYTWNVESEPPTNISLPILTASDLDGRQTALLNEMIAEDLIFYASVAAAFANLTSLSTHIRGRTLSGPMNSEQL